MAVVSFIEKRDQGDVIEKILKYCVWGGTCADTADREPPASRLPVRDRRQTGALPRATGPPVQPVLDLQYVSDDEFLMAL